MQGLVKLSSRLCWLRPVRYPVNKLTIGTAEVSGASAVFVDDITREKGSRRASMKADRFMQNTLGGWFELVKMAKAAGFRIISLEDSGIWNHGRMYLASFRSWVGEHDGVSKPILNSLDSVIRVPMSGLSHRTTSGANGCRSRRVTTPRNSRI